LDFSGSDDITYLKTIRYSTYCIYYYYFFAYYFAFLFDINYNTIYNHIKEQGNDAKKMTEHVADLK